MHNNPGRSRARTIGKTILVVGLAVFLVRVLITNWERIAGYGWEIRPAPLALSFFFLILFYLASFLLWQQICWGMRVPLPPLLNFGIWFFSQTGKYLPGKVWGAVGRIYLSEQRGVRKMDTGICLAYEAVFTTLGGGVIVLVTIPFWAGAGGLNHPGWLLLALSGGLVLMHPRVMGWFINRALRVFQIPSVSISFSGLFLVQLLSISLLLWIVGGVGFFFLVDAIFPSEGSVITYGGVFVAACMMGILSFLTPAGLGVREGGFILLMQPFMPSEAAIVIAFAARFWMTCVEVIGIGIGGGIILKSHKEAESTRKIAEYVERKGENHS